MMFVPLYAISVCEHYRYLISSEVGLFSWITRFMDGGRNDEVIDGAFDLLAQAIAQNPLNNQNARKNDEFRALGKFQRNNPLTFKGRYDPEGAYAWIREIKKIL